MADSAETSIVTSLRLSKALGFARAGRLREAQQLLAAEGTLPEHPLELHALAALATGEGDYSRALRLWRLLLQREPGHAEAKHMIDTIELWLSRPKWVSYIPVTLLAIAIGLVVSIALVATSGPSPVPVRANPVVRPSATPAYVQPSAPQRSYAPAQEEGPTVTFPATKPAETKRRRSTR